MYTQLTLCTVYTIVDTVYSVHSVDTVYSGHTVHKMADLFMVVDMNVRLAHVVVLAMTVVVVVVMVEHLGHRGHGPKIERYLWA